MAQEVPAYPRLQDEVAAATGGVDARRILELGTGTGETARRVLAVHPDARLEDPLPEGPFELVVSALAVHHLDAAGKADLFRRVARVLRPGGRLVLADVVIPEKPEDAVAPLSADYDLPDTVPDQLAWLDEAGFDARVTWQLRDLAVFAATPR
jgi:tRNA (cmo5U34)-methyltransferase